jgi:hypothetical protein
VSRHEHQLIVGVEIVRDFLDRRSKITSPSSSRASNWNGRCKRADDAHPGSWMRGGPRAHSAGRSRDDRIMEAGESLA